MRYKITFEPLAKDWLDRQTEDVRKRVLSILSNTAEDPHNAGYQLQNPYWYDFEWGWSRKVYADSAINGLRCIYFVSDSTREMIVIKIGTHDDDVYEDGN